MLTSADLIRARELIGGHINQTPVITSSTFSHMTGAEVFLKLETLQKAGSFKVRGAMHKILKNRALYSKSGVVAASAGNHAQGVAVASRIAGISALIVMPEWASLSKQEATEGYGAEVLLSGKTLEESLKKAEEISREGRNFIHPFDDEEIIAGQATIGLEILEAVPDCDTIIAPIGGGGLISGIALGVKAIRPSCRIIGVQVKSCPSVAAARDEGIPVCISAGRTIADGIRVTRTGDLTWPIIRDNVDELILVDEDQIADAMLLLMERKKVVAEGAGAASLAALLSPSCTIRPGEKVILVISGGNVDSHQLGRVLRGALARQGRLFQLPVVIEDLPGSLAALLALVAREGGNILQIYHTSFDPLIPIGQVRVDIELETRGPDHIRIIQETLHNAGYQLPE